MSKRDQRKREAGRKQIRFDKIGNGNTDYAKNARRQWLAENLDRIKKLCETVKANIGRYPFCVILSEPNNIAAFVDSKEMATSIVKNGKQYPLTEILEDMLLITLDSSCDTHIIVEAANGVMRTSLSQQLLKQKMIAMGANVSSYNYADVVRQQHGMPASTGE